MENLIYLVPIVFFAGIIRGYSGFGFAVIAVIGLNLFLDPIKSVPIVLALDFVCSIGLIREAIKHANMSTFRIIAGGSILGIPIGLILLYLIPPLWLKLAICCFVLVLVMLLIKKAKPVQKDSFSKKLFTGIASGVGTSSASIGGPMILYYILSSPLDVRAQRATMILFFIVSEFMALVGLGISQTSSNEVYISVLWLLVPTMIGVKIGQFFFNKRPPKSFKSISLPLMVIVALVGFAQAFSAL
ncbi:sulfite exporter TauE/SafE family protein [Marinomonas arenicola]|uniref:sulfite exporter TauE/SafE family protein n=1 Tax=Marinomonas arenicola TaxID=569601 RepID=UPI00312043D4